LLETRIIMVLVKHYTNYQTGEFKMMEKGAHFALHRRLRLDGKCKIPVRDLQRISNNRHFKDDDKHILFYETIMPNVIFHEQVTYDTNTGTFYYIARFRANNKRRLLYIDI